MSRRKRRRDRESADALPPGLATSLFDESMTHESAPTPPEQTPDEETAAEEVRPAQEEPVRDAAPAKEETAEGGLAESRPMEIILPEPRPYVELPPVESAPGEEPPPVESAPYVEPPPVELSPYVEPPPVESQPYVEPAPVMESADDEAVPAAMTPELEPIELDSLAPEAVAPPSGDRRRGPRFNFITGTLILSSIALFGGYLVVNLVLMPSLTRQGVEVRVPEVIGLSEREAERLLAGEDLKLSKISEQWSPDVPRGFITAQDPTAGGIVKRGRRISVIVSLGAQGTSVPILEGVTARQAEIMLEGAGLKLGRYARAYSDQVSKDLVIATDPPGETVVEQETAVDLLVSLGPVPRTFVLPELEGRDASSAARSLRDEGFTVSLREGSGKQKSGLVTGQEPPAGHRVAPRDSIVLYYHP